MIIDDIISYHIILSLTRDSWTPLETAHGTPIPTPESR